MTRERATGWAVLALGVLLVAIGLFAMPTSLPDLDSVAPAERKGKLEDWIETNTSRARIGQLVLLVGVGCGIAGTVLVLRRKHVSADRPLL